MVRRERLVRDARTAPLRPRGFRRRDRTAVPRRAVPVRSLRSVADRLDVMAIEVEDEGAVVVRMVLRPQTRRPVVPPAGPERGLVEGAHLGPRLDREGDVHGRSGLTVAADPELRLAALAETARPDLALGLLGAELHHEGDPERRQHLSVEGPGAKVVGDPEAEMIDDHGSPPSRKDRKSV